MLNHDERRGCITASEIGAIAGRGRFATTADVMRRKVRDLNGLPPEFTGNVATQWGHDYEGDAIAEFEFISGESVYAKGDDQQFRKIEIVADGFPLLIGCTPDGITKSGGLVEAKCPYGKRNESPDALAYLQSAPEYLDQMQWQMLVTGMDHCNFVVWTTMGVDYTVIVADPVRQEQLAAIAAEFQRVLDKIMADPELQAPYLRDKGEVAHRDDDEFRDAAERYKAASAALEAAEAAMETARSELLALVTESTEGCGVKINKTERKGSVDYGKIPELKGVDLEQYRKKSSIVWSVKV